MTTKQNENYGTVAKLLHWLVLGLLAVQFTIAWTMPHVGRNTRPEGLIAWHLWIGLLILLLIAIRLLWRLRHPAPPLPAGLPRWQVSLSRLVHFLLYAILVLLPLMGWGNASARGWDIPKIFRESSDIPGFSGTWCSEDHLMAVVERFRD
jgi:cytochrome b561